MPSDETAIVLDYLPEGRMESNIPGYRREKNVAQIVGDRFFSLLEIVLREGHSTSASKVLYIGKGVREDVHHIVKRLNYDELTSTGKVELEFTLDKLISEQEERFIKFFNECGPLTTRLHRLELLPGVGKKHMMELVRIRNIKLFESFADLAERVKLLPDPKKILIKRIIWELRGEDDRGKQIKYKLLVGVPLFADDVPTQEAPSEAALAEASSEEVVTETKSEPEASKE
ncbi:MAG: hypothetical protein CL963_03590 [Euryarchaeota archaeon]|jgi:putative nucleotide binding protein|nr:hypothetical protein [Euryarchaeota archaeon]HIK01236.1 DUF655 domain-containing protein [Candidatus Undinarchaeales archaeon ERR594346 U_76725]|tara:strand:- start:6965 stop:7654 length:690 start_codon:yes stop_codon:yes gene_type:complete